MTTDPTGSRSSAAPTEEALECWEDQPVVRLARRLCPPDVTFPDFLEALDGILTDLEDNHPDMWSAVMREGVKPPEPEVPVVTNGQKEIFDMVESGLSHRQVADVLGVSRPYVTKVVKLVRERLGAPGLVAV